VTVVSEEMDKEKEEEEEEKSKEKGKGKIDNKLLYSYPIGTKWKKKDRQKK
jgi:hypothetical protein